MSTSEIAAKLREYRSMKEMQNEIEETLSALEDEIKAAMGESEEISAEGIKAKWTRYTAARFDTKTFKAEHATMYEQYVKNALASRFQVVA